MTTNGVSAELSGQTKVTEVIDQDEVDQVLAALRALKNQVANPVIKECLEAARFDITHLASVGELSDDLDEDYDEDEEEDYDDEDGAEDEE